VPCRSPSVDESTGNVLATTTGTQGRCLDGAAYMMVKIDPVAGTASPAASMPACTVGVAPDNKGTTLYVAAGSAQPDPEEGGFPASTYFTVDQSALTRTPADSIGTFGPAWVTYDPVRNVIVEASIVEANFETDNNAMSEITVINRPPSHDERTHPRWTLSGQRREIACVALTSPSRQAFCRPIRSAWV
jgi:hypothetical protein